MKQFLLLSFAIFALAGIAFAQTRQLPIDSIQTVPLARLHTCDDTSAFINQRVSIKGIVIAPGNALAVSNQMRQFWMRDINGSASRLYTAIAVRMPNGFAPPVDARTLVAGDTVKVVGTVQEFSGSGLDGGTQILPDSVVLIAPYRQGSPVPQPYRVALSQLNDVYGINYLEKGEQYEGDFVEIRNVTVHVIDYFTAAGVQRFDFMVRDSVGNSVRILDTFRAMRLPAGQVAGTCGLAPGNPYASFQCGDFIIDSSRVGLTYCSIKGIVTHKKNGCPGTSTYNYGYTISPFSSSHFVTSCSSLPTIVSEPNIPAGIVMYPNPAAGTVKLSVKEVPKAGYTITIADVRGNAIKNTTGCGASHEVSLDGLSSGIYIVTATDGSGKIMYRNKLAVNK